MDSFRVSQYPAHFVELAVCLGTQPKSCFGISRCPFLHRRCNAVRISSGLWLGHSGGLGRTAGCGAIHLPYPGSLCHFYDPCKLRRLSGAAKAACPAQHRFHRKQVLNLTRIKQAQQKAAFPYPSATSGSQSLCCAYFDPLIFLLRPAPFLCHRHKTARSFPK